MQPATFQPAMGDTQAYNPFESPAAALMGMEQIGQNWFVTLGDHILHFTQGQPKLTVLQKLFMQKHKGNGPVSWLDLEDALAREDFTMPRLTKLFTSRTARMDRIAMFAEALNEELRRKTLGEWKITTLTASNGDVYYSLKSGF